VTGITLRVAATGPAFLRDASELSERLQLPLYDETGDPDALLEVGDFGLRLKPLGRLAPGPVAVDFADAGMRHRRRGGHNELLGRAVGAALDRSLHVVDATAGLGRDAFVMADLGCRVTLLERSPLVHALLADGLARATGIGDPWLTACVARMTLVKANAVDWLDHSGAASVDVVYLDPMFPQRRKAARAKKEMWLFQHLEAVAGDDDDLLAAALSAARYRVVVKRPLKGAVLVGRPPTFDLRGRSVRFDVYSNRKLA
jgi:16S rRNA (guanine1516-N2)-methyltransferase